MRGAKSRWYVAIGVAKQKNGCGFDSRRVLEIGFPTLLSASPRSVQKLDATYFYHTKSLTTEPERFLTNYAPSSKYPHPFVQWFFAAFD